MQIKLNTERKLVELQHIQVGEIFLYCVERDGGELIPLLKTSEKNDCHEVGGFRTFSFANSTGVFPVTSLTVDY